MSTVLKDFVCKKTGKLFKAGDTYTGDRLEELQELGYVGEGDDANEEWPKHLGGGLYELSNGEKVKGKKVAIEAQAELDELADE